MQFCKQVYRAASRIRGSACLNEARLKTAGVLFLAGEEFNIIPLNGGPGLKKKNPENSSEFLAGRGFEYHPLNGGPRLKKKNPENSSGYFSQGGGDSNTTPSMGALG